MMYSLYLQNHLSKGVCEMESFEYVKINSVEFPAIEEDNKYTQPSRPMILDQYTDDGRFIYTFSVDHSAPENNCARIEIEYNWPITPDFDAMLKEIHRKYVHWQGYTEEGYYAGGLFCAKDISNQGRIIGIGRMRKKPDGMTSNSISYSESFETIRGKTDKGTHSDKRYTERKINKSDEDISADVDRLIKDTELHRLEARLISRLNLQSIKLKDPNKIMEMDDELEIIEKACGTISVMDRLMDIDSYKNSNRPNSNYRSSEKRLRKFP